jgi:hypothetical protein
MWVIWYFSMSLIISRGSALCMITLVCATYRYGMRKQWSWAQWKSRQGVEAHVVSLVLPVEDAAVVLRHEGPVREHGTLGLDSVPLVYGICTMSSALTSTWGSFQVHALHLGV